MTEVEQTDKKSNRSTRPRKHRAGAGLLSTLILASLLLVGAAFVLSGRPVALPDAAESALVRSINERLSDGLSVSVEAVSVAMEGPLPRATLRGVSVQGEAGNTLAALNRIDVDLSLGALLQGRFNAVKVALEGAQITLRRGADGVFSVSGGSSSTQEPTPLSATNVLAAIDAAFEDGPLAALGEVEARGFVITVEDARTQRIWQATNATLLLRERVEGVSVSVVSDVFNGTDDLARLQLSFSFDQETRDTALGVAIEDMPARDIALQSPALEWLALLDAPISGAVRGTIAGNGTLESLDGKLDLQAGTLRPDTSEQPVGFDAAHAYFTYDPELERLHFDDIGITSPTLKVSATGHAYLVGEPGTWDQSFVGQFDFVDTAFRSETTFEAPVSADRIRTDFRLSLDPFRVEIADALLEHEDTLARATGRVTIEEGRWQVVVDAESDRIHRDRVMSFWPVALAPKTRSWLSENVLDGDLFDVSFGVRHTPGREADISLSFDYENARVRYLPEMPVVQDGSGRAVMNDHAFVIEVDQGWLSAPDGGRIDGGGTVFAVPDTREKPARGVLSLSAEGELASVLELIDRPPLRLMRRAGRGTDIAKAQARVDADIALPLRDGIRAADVNYEVRALANDVTSDVLVPGRALEASSLRLRATPDGVSIDGRGQLDGVAFDTAWKLPLGADAGSGSSAKGDIALNAGSLAAFGVNLPSGTIRGDGRASYEVVMSPDATPSLTIQSDLRGLGISLPAIGWSKSPSAEGGLELDVALGPRPDIEKLELSAPGLAMSGGVEMDESGAVSEIALSRLRVGNWLDASARVRVGGAAGRPAVSIDGGRLDLRALPEFGNGTSDGDTRPGDPISLAFDTVVLTDDVSLAPFRGQVRPSLGGLDGDFEARVAGRTLVRGSLAPAFGRTALRVEADDAGDLLRDFGITPNARNGSFYMVMTPVSGAPEGTYDGEFIIENMRLQDAPLMAGLLNAISVVGLLDQLGGGGLSFDTIDGAFRVTPERIVLNRLAAVGPSLGISADGIYDPASKELDMQGVVSPIYFVNGIGALLTRRGEGLFGFNYRVTGPTNGPTVSVNPLSILTPGMFREIFRRPVPTE